MDLLKIVHDNSEITELNIYFVIMNIVYLENKSVLNAHSR